MQSYQQPPLVSLPPLKITCTSSNCGSGLHCFLKSRKMAAAQKGRCRVCNADLIDWQRVQQRDPEDAAFTFQALKCELIRHHYWHKEIDPKAEKHARRKGRIALEEVARKRIQKSVGAAKPSFNGRQTPDEGNILYYAQHALACCCRKCMEYWHDIPQGTPLTDEQAEYFVRLIMMYVDERMPDLKDTGEKIPYARRTPKRHDQETH